MALAFARLMAPPDWLPGPFRDAAVTVREAMMAHPYLVAGGGRVDTDVMEAVPGVLVAKGGAGGVRCIGLPGGIGIAVKIEDGASSSQPGGPAAVATLEVLRRLGVLDEAAWTALRRHALPAITSVAGEHGGDVRPAFQPNVNE